VIEHATEAATETPQQGYTEFLRAEIVGDARGAVDRMTALAQMSMIDQFELETAEIPVWVPPEFRCEYVIGARHPTLAMLLDFDVPISFTDVEVSPDAARFTVSVTARTGGLVSARIEMSREDGRWLIADSSDV